jgi:hypothetical protein
VPGVVSNARRPNPSVPIDAPSIRAESARPNSHSRVQPNTRSASVVASVPPDCPIRLAADADPTQDPAQDPTQNQPRSQPKTTQQDPIALPSDRPVRPYPIRFYLPCLDHASLSSTERQSQIRKKSGYACSPENAFFLGRTSETRDRFPPGSPSSLPPAPNRSTARAAAGPRPPLRPAVGFPGG